MNKKPGIQRAKRTDNAMRARVRKKLIEREVREKWVQDIQAGPQDPSVLKKPEAAKIYIQHAMALSVRKRNKDLLLNALREVANATDNTRALRLINISDGDFISVNAILLELGYYLQFDKM